MKCGMELMELSKQAEELKNLRKMADLAAAREEKRKRREYTIHWCDTTLSDYLEKAAVRGDLNAHNFFYNYSNEEMWFGGYEDFHGFVNDLRALEKDSIRYANGDFSYTMVGPYFDTETIISYCKEHCILVQIKRANYKSYGCGLRNGFMLGFKLSPECDPMN